MKIRVIGCGNAFSFKNFNQSFLLEENGVRLLVDCGNRIPMALHEAGIDINSINEVYISHQHGDHCGGLEEFAFSRYEWINRPEHWKEWKSSAPKLICNEDLMKDLWNETLKGGLKSMEGFNATLETFFRPMPIKGNQTFLWEGWKCSLVQQIHIMTGSIFSNTFGLFMEKKGQKSIYFTTDSQHCSPKQIEIFYDRADIIIQDCECSGLNTKTGDLAFSSGVHANYAQLAGYPSANTIKLSKEIKAKMYLSHYQDFVNSNLDFFGQACDWEKLAEKDGFAGFLKVGQIIDTGE